MFLDKPAFPVSVEIGKAEETAARYLESKNWRNYQFYKVTVLYIPYYFFSYDIFDETGGKTLIISKGKSALNAHRNELNDEFENLAIHESGNANNEITHNYHYDVLKPKISEKEAKEIIPIRLASKMNASKNNVILSGLEMYYVALWTLEFSLSNHNYTLRMNATTGEILNPHVIVQREKTENELINEAAEEIANPANWPGYTIDVLSSFFKWLAGFFAKKSAAHKESKEGLINLEVNVFNLKTRDLLVIVLGIVAILLVMQMFNKI